MTWGWNLGCVAFIQQGGTGWIVLVGLVIGIGVRWARADCSVGHVDLVIGGGLLLRAVNTHV